MLSHGILKVRHFSMRDVMSKQTSATFLFGVWASSESEESEPELPELLSSSLDDEEDEDVDPSFDL